MKRQHTDEQATELYQDESHWLPPVDTEAQLPAQDVKPGAFCFVQDRGAVFQYDSEKGWFTTKGEKGDQA